MKMTDISTTQIYAKIVDKYLLSEINTLNRPYDNSDPFHENLYFGSHYNRTIHLFLTKN